jgi:hypothetical protein
MKTGLLVIVTVFLGFIFSQTMWAQSYASINGAVTDPSQAVVSGAVIELVNVNTLAKRETTTDKNGFYLFAQVPPDSYQITARAKGFANKTITGLRLLVNSPSTVNISLQVAGAGQSVSVNASAESLNLTDASLGNVIETEAISQLPLFARNPAGLLAFQPGVTTFTTNVVPTDDRNGAVNGGKSDQANITLDGVDVNEQQTRPPFTTALRVTLDSVQEFRSTTLNATSDEGRSSGAQIALVTKSGTDSLHGSLYEYNRNTITASNDYFLNSDGIKTPALNINVFGASVGGPIIKKKAFFFVNYEGRRDASAVSELRMVPTATARQGTVQYVNTSGQTETLTPTDITDNIDPLHIGPDQAMLTLLQSYPLPNDSTVGDGLNSAGFRFAAPRHAKQDTYIARLDYDVSSNNTLFWRGNLQNDHTGGTPEFPGQFPSGVALNDSKGFVAGWTFTPRSNLVNSVHFGLTREGTGNPGTLTESVSLPNTSWISSPLALTTGLSHTIPVYQISDDLSLIHGKHEIHLGALLLFVRNSSTSYAHSFSSAQIVPDILSGAGTSLQPADLNANFIQNYRWSMADVLGLLNDGTSNYNYTVQGNALPPGAPLLRDWGSNDYEPYISDTWKINRALTLTAGLRWSLSPPVYEVNGQQVSTSESLGTWFVQRGILAAEGSPQSQAGPVTYVAGNSPQGRPLYPFRKKDFAPRVAFAYSPQSDDGWIKHLTGGPGKTVIRAGWGMFYDIVGQPLAATWDSNAFGLATTLSSPPGAYTPSTTPRFTGLSSIPPALITPAPPGGFPQVAPNDFAAVGGINDQLKTPYNMSTNFTIERQLPAEIAVQVSYVGRFSRHSLTQRDLAAPTNLLDTASGTTYFQAAEQLERLVLKGTPVSQVPAIPFWENVWPAAAGNGLTATQAIYQIYSQYGPDWTTSLTFPDTSCVPACSKFGPYAMFNQQFASLPAWDSSGLGSYNAMQWSVRKTFSQGLLFNFNWTWSKSMDDSSRAEAAGAWAFGLGNVNTDNQENVWNPRQSYGVSDYDVTHELNAFAVWTLPIGRGRKFARESSGLVNAIIGGWQVSPAWSQTTGLPISPRDGRAGATDYWIVGFATLTGPKPDTHTTLLPSGPNMFVNSQAALADYSYTLTGLEGARNQLRADGTFDIDFGLSKRWTMPYNESHSLQFRWETFNLTNTPTFDVSSLQLRISNSANFGGYSSAMNTPRQMQFALRYEF